MLAFAELIGIRNGCYTADSEYAIVGGDPFCKTPPDQSYVHADTAYESIRTLGPVFGTV